MALLEFFSCANRLDINYAIDRQDAIQMVDFMLQQFGKIAIFSGFDLEGLAAQILVAHGDFTVTFHLHKNREKTQAGVPYDDGFRAPVNDFGIDERPGFRAGEFQKDHALQDTDLRGGYCSAVPGRRAPVGERVSEISDNRANLSRSGIGNRSAFLPQNWVAELQDRSNGH